jgi:hypothetical protein
METSARAQKDSKKSAEMPRTTKEHEARRGKTWKDAQRCAKTRQDATRRDKGDGSKGDVVKVRLMGERERKSDARSAFRIEQNRQL